jgi:glycosyltransferase involved in cell wall biosynthesis
VQLHHPIKIFVTGLRGFPDVQGGVETHCEHLYPRLADLGCEIICARRTPYVNDGRRRWRGVRFLDMWCPRRKSLEALSHTALATLAAAEVGADLLHIHAVGPALCTPLARTLGLKVVVTTQGSDYERQKWGPVAKTVLRLGERWGAVYADRIIAVTRHIATRLRRNYGASATVIPNGVEIPRLPESSDQLRRWNLKPGHYAFALGRFVPEKGFHDLLDAWEGLETDWKLALAGTADHPTPYSRSLRKRAEEMNGVVPTGFVKGDALSQLYAHSGLFVLPSYHEGLPLVLLEALSYRCNVVASDIPAVRAVDIREDRFVPPGDVRALREGMRRWMDRGISGREREENLRTLRRNYSWDVIARRTRDVYRSVLRRL